MAITVRSPVSRWFPRPRANITRNNDAVRRADFGRNVLIIRFQKRICHFRRFNILLWGVICTWTELALKIHSAVRNRGVILVL
jgi:hypothetical protein